MKKIFQKNQLIITALALMIAVAGYFSYMNNHIDDGTAAETAANAGTDALNAEYEISDEDPLAAEDIFTDEGTGEELALVDGTETADAGTGEDTYDAADAAVTDGQDVAENAADGQNAVADVSADAADVADMTSQDAEEIENPGEAVLTSTGTANLDYAARMKLNREQIRSKNKEALLEIVNNTSVADNLKQDAVNKMVAMTDIAEREAAAEMLLEAKGFSDVVVSITDDNCDVVLNMGEVTDAKRAQVEDIVKRKTNISQSLFLRNFFTENKSHIITFFLASASKNVRQLYSPPDTACRLHISVSGAAVSFPVLCPYPSRHPPTRSRYSGSLFQNPPVL